MVVTQVSTLTIWVLDVVLYAMRVMLLTGLLGGARGLANVICERPTSMSEPQQERNSHLGSGNKDAGLIVLLGVGNKSWEYQGYRRDSARKGNENGNGQKTHP
mgnify:CR=1 FL=1